MSSPESQRSERVQRPQINVKAPRVVGEVRADPNEAVPGSSPSPGMIPPAKLAPAKRGWGPTSLKWPYTSASSGVLPSFSRTCLGESSLPGFSALTQRSANIGSSANRSIEVDALQHGARRPNAPAAGRRGCRGGCQL